MTEGNFYYIIKNSSTAYFGAVQKNGKIVVLSIGQWFTLVARGRMVVIHYAII